MEIRKRFETIAAGVEGPGHFGENRRPRQRRSGFKFAEYEFKGVPVRLAMGPRDMENGTIELVRRDTLEKETVPQEGPRRADRGPDDRNQENIYRKALAYRNSMITKVDTWEEFKRVLDEKGGFISAHWDGTVETGGHQGCHEGDDPLHSARRRRGGGTLHLHRQALAPPRALRPQLLIRSGTEPTTDIRTRKSVVRMFFFSPSSDPRFAVRRIPRSRSRKKNVTFVCHETGTLLSGRSAQCAKSIR